MTREKPSIDYESITRAQQSVWATGDFGMVALSIVPVSEALVASVDPHPGQRVLDVACGSGNTALVAARRYCDVTGIDYVPALLERAKQRAAAEGTPIDFRLGDAQALPFPDGSFDVVLSTFGVMFAPNQEAAAAEILRVCRPGASIGMANWVPEGGIADFFRVHSQYAPPPPGLESPTRWGTEAGLRELLGAGTRSIETRQCVVTEHFRSIDHAVAVFRDYFGPTRRALDQLDRKGREALLLDLTALLTRLNRAKDGTVALPFEYVEVVAHLR